MKPNEIIEQELNTFSSNLEKLMKEFNNKTGLFVTEIILMTHRTSRTGMSYINRGEYKKDKVIINHIGISD